MVRKAEENAIKLSAADKKQLEDLSVDIKRGEKAIAALKELDVDVKGIEEKLQWAKSARDMLLKEFI